MPSNITKKIKQMNVVPNQPQKWSSNIKLWPIATAKVVKL